VLSFAVGMPCVAHVESYGKGVVVKGDTREIKDFLKGLGGRWNMKLVGWMFPGSKRDELVKALGSNPKVSTVVDRTGGGESAATSSTAPAVTAVARARDEDDEAPLLQPKAAAAAAQPAEQEASTDGGIVFTLADTMRVTVSNFQGKNGVDIRKFYQDNNSKKFLPTAKGIWLKAAEWEALRNKFSQIDAAPADESKLEVVGDVLAMKKTGIVDIRRFYTDKNDGEKKPTKKGAYMQQELWSKLQKIAAQVTEALEDPPDAIIGSPKKKQRTEKQAKAPAASTSGGDDGPLSPKQLKKELKSLLKGRDLGAITLKSVRAELEAKLSLPDGGLNERKDEIKTVITRIVQLGE